MRKLCVIGWRPVGYSPLFFRGDSRYEIFLPYISEEMISKGKLNGWVPEIRYARVFETPVLIGKENYAKYFIFDRFDIFPYEEALLPTQIFKPIRKPQRKSLWQSN